MFVLANMWFQTLMRQFFFNIDKIVFNFISTIYDFLITIARTSVLSQSDIIDMADRIYKLLAVFMVFKVTFSLIMYVVNPDDFSDKSKGIGKLSTNIIISLSLLILTPFAFSYAYRIQTIILEDNSLAALIFGEDNDNANESYFNTAGDKMAYATMAPFFTPNLGIEDLYPCAKLTTRDSKGNIIMNKECASALESLAGEDRFSEQTYVNYKIGVEKGVLGVMFRQDAATAIVEVEDEEVYVLDYRYLFSTVVGIVVILLLITFCMDVALRSIKLAFLQLIAPIPIISYVDPKSGKDGMFKKWYQMCFKTYLSLFIRLLALYFAVYIISRLDKMVDIVTGAYVTNALLKIMIIIGALMFAKQLPKILEGLGIKLDGDGKFFLNPIKKFGEEALGGKKIAEALDTKKLRGAAKGFAAGTFHGIAGAATGAGIGRAFTGGLTGMKAGYQGKKLGEIRKDQNTRNAEMRRAIAAGSSWGERMGTRVSSFLGTPGRLGRIEHDRMMVQNQIDAKKQEKSENNNSIQGYKRQQAKKKAEIATIDAMKERAAAQIEKGKGGAATTDYLNAKSKYEKMVNQGVVDGYRKATDSEIGDARRKLDDMKKGREVTRSATDSEISAKQAEINSLKTRKSMVGADGKPMANDDMIKQAERELNDLKTKGVTERVSYSDDEISRAEKEFKELEEKGVFETRTATEEEITQARVDYQAKQKKAQLSYITDALNGNIEEDLVMNNAYDNYVATLDNPDEALKDGNDLDVRGGTLQSEHDAIQRDHIDAVEKANQDIDDEIAVLETRASELNAEKEDAKASQEAVHGLDGGPRDPSEIADSNPAHRNYRYNYREGGIGSGVEGFESGDVGSSPPPRPPHGPRPGV